MSLQANLSDIAASIKAKADDITSHLAQDGNANLSFALGSPSRISLPAEIEAQRQGLLDLLTRFRLLLEGPSVYMNSIVGPEAGSVYNSINALEQFSVPKNLPIGSMMSIVELASRCNMNVTDLTIYMRLAVASHIFEEPQKGMIRHNAASALMVQSASLGPWMKFVHEDTAPAMYHSIEAAKRFPDSGEPTECGFSVALAKSGELEGCTKLDGLGNGAKAPLQSYFGSMNYSRDRSTRFIECMREFHASPPMDANHLVNGFADVLADIHQVAVVNGTTTNGTTTNGTAQPKVTVVDVGGSAGLVACALARRYPQVHAVVEDLPVVISAAEAVIPEDLAGRVRFQAQDMFEEQAVCGADIYLLRLICHDWSDAYARKILRRLVPAMRPRTRIVINDVCLPEPGAHTPAEDDRMMHSYSMVMKSLFNSYERDEDGWRHLLDQADERFRLRRIIRPEGSRLSLMEVEWTGQ